MKTKKKKALKAMRRQLRVPIVEVNVSDFCEHGCFVVWLGSPSVWRFVDGAALSCEVEDGVRFHTMVCEDQDHCVSECWEED